MIVLEMNSNKKNSSMLKNAEKCCKYNEDLLQIVIEQKVVNGMS